MCTSKEQPNSNFQLIWVRLVLFRQQWKAISRYIVKSDRFAVTESLKNQPAWQRIGRMRQGWYELVLDCYFTVQSAQKAQGGATLVAVMGDASNAITGQEEVNQQDDSEIKSFCGNWECDAASSSPKESQSWWSAHGPISYCQDGRRLQNGQQESAEKHQQDV